MGRIQFYLAGIAILAASGRLLLASLPTALLPLTCEGSPYVEPFPLISWRTRFVEPFPLISWRTNEPYTNETLPVVLSTTGDLWRSGEMLGYYAAEALAGGVMNQLLAFLGACGPVFYGTIFLCTLLSMATPDLVRLQRRPQKRVIGFGQWITASLFAAAIWGCAYVIIVAGIFVSSWGDGSLIEPEFESGFYQAAVMVALSALYAAGYGLEFQDMLDKRTGQIQLGGGDVEAAIFSPKPLVEEKQEALVEV